MTERFWIGCAVLAGVVAACASREDTGDETHFQSCDTTADCANLAGEHECVESECRRAPANDGGTQIPDAMPDLPDAPHLPDAPATERDGDTEREPPPFQAVDPSACAEENPELRCCLEGQLEDPVCVAAGFWRCDGSWPLDTEGECVPGYSAKWSTVGADLEWCDGAVVVGFGVSLPELPEVFHIEWSVAEDSPFHDDGDVPADTTLQGTFVGATAVECLGGECVELGFEIDGEETAIVASLSVEEASLLSAGEDVVLRRHLGMISVERADTSTFVFAISAGEISDTLLGATWTAGPFTLSAAETGCAVEALGCNFRDVLFDIRVEWSGGERVLRRGEFAVVEAGGASYRIEFGGSSHDAGGAFGMTSCAVIRSSYDRFRIVRQPG